MKANMRMLLERCIEEGLERGYNRAHKHTENPTQDGMITSMQDAIWLEIDTFFKFENDND